jgi:hypothetical protein
LFEERLPPEAGPGGGGGGGMPGIPGAGGGGGAGGGPGGAARAAVSPIVTVTDPFLSDLWHPQPLHRSVLGPKTEKNL